MSQEVTSTEDEIFRAALRVFLRKGMDATRMQDIADEAGISRTSLHYYYRNKERLYNSVFDHTLKRLFNEIAGTIVGDNQKSFRDMLEKFVESYLSILGNNPNLPFFIMNEMQNNPEKVIDRFRSFEGQIETLERYFQTNLRDVGITYSWNHFLINLIAMCVFPYLARPMLSEFLLEDDETFEELIDKRKAVIVNTLLPTQHK